MVRPAGERIKQLGALQQRCHLFVTVDGAPNPLAAALKVPTLTLFGSSDPVVWGPWGPDNRWLKKGNYINDIEAEEVLEHASAMLAQGQDQPRSAAN